MRHSRSRQFDEGRARAAAGPVSQRWTAVATDPNDAAAVAHRSSVLRAAWRPPIPDRLAFLEDRCRDRRVLDIGCVAHDLARLNASNWLHGRIASVASECIGVDVLEEEIAELNRRGFHAVAHDLSTGLGPIKPMAPFDVILAGELIEHVPDVNLLFRIARDALTPGGQLIVTTPNPFAPHRAVAGQRCQVWENVDHIFYAFPSGMAELAERNELQLTEAFTTSVPRPFWSGPRRALAEVRRAVRGTRWLRVGYTTGPTPRITRIRGGLVLRPWRRSEPSFAGETAIYVMTRTEAHPSLP